MPPSSSNGPNHLGLLPQGGRGQPEPAGNQPFWAARRGQVGGGKTLPWPCVSTAFAAETLPLPCFSTAFVAKTLPSLELPGVVCFCQGLAVQVGGRGGVGRECVTGLPNGTSPAPLRPSCVEKCDKQAPMDMGFSRRTWATPSQHANLPLQAVCAACCVLCAVCCATLCVVSCVGCCAVRCAWHCVLRAVHCAWRCVLRLLCCAALSVLCVVLCGVLCAMS